MAFADAQIARGLKKQARGDVAGALGHYRAVLSRKPRHAHALYFTALACQQLKQYDAAIHCMTAVTKLEPSHADAWYNLGKMYQDIRQPETALAHYIAALEKDDQHIEALTNAGNLYLEFGQSAVAEVCYHRALATNPNRPEAQYNRSFVKLARGDESGWIDHEARWRCPGHIAEHWRDFMDDIPAWNGAPIPGKRLLLHAEQGFGDTIHFIRYAHRARELSQASISIEVQRPLHRLMANSFPDVTIIPRGDPMPEADYHASLMSLPALCGGLDAQIPYLHHNSPTFYDPRGIIGVCWAGSSGHLNDHNRSIPFDTFRPIIDAAPGAVLSLQVGERAKDAAVIPVCTIEPDDFHDTADAIASCSLVITVDTSVAHVAGALGVPTWLMLPAHPDFRWMNEGDTTPLYPSMTLYRQSKRQDWTPVVERITADLRARHG